MNGLESLLRLGLNAGKIFLEQWDVGSNRIGHTLLEFLTFNGVRDHGLVLSCFLGRRCDLDDWHGVLQRAAVNACRASTASHLLSGPLQQGAELSTPLFRLPELFLNHLDFGLLCLFQRPLLERVSLARLFQFGCQAVRVPIRDASFSQLAPQALHH